MIKFFRKIRYKLIENSKMSRYFKYAIGEIILVVIGILLALQFNNWNEARKRQLELDKLLYDIEEDLIVNYKQANAVLRFYKKQDSIAKRIAAKELTERDYRENYGLNYFVANWDYYVPNEKNVIQFVEAEKIVDLKYKPILDAAKKLQLYRSILDDTFSNLEQNIDESVDILSSRTWFVKNDSISYRQRLDYMLEDPEYEVMVLKYWIMVQNHYDKISRYRAQTMATLASIKMIRDNYDTLQLNAMFNSLGMQQYVVYKCDVNPSELKHLRDLRSSALYGNLSEVDIHLILTNNKGQHVNDFRIPPKTFQTIPGSEYFGIDGDNNLLVNHIDNNGDCITKYGGSDNGYLIIE